MEYNWYIEKQSAYEHHEHAYTRTLYRGATAFQDVAVVESPVYRKILILDGDIQSAEADEYIYHEALVHPAMTSLPRPARRVLILGGGEGATLREVLRHREVERVVMVDLDGELVRICREILPEWSQGCFDDPRLELHHEDARAWLESCRETFDIVLNDLPQPLEESPLRLLFTRQFFESVKKVLAPDGFLCMQACSTKTAQNHINLTIRKTVGEVFDHTHSMKVFIPFFATEWGFVIASPSVDALEVTTREINQRLAERLASPLRFYRGRAHHSMLDMTPAYEEALARHELTLDDSRPLRPEDIRAMRGELGEA